MRWHQGYKWHSTFFKFLLLWMCHCVVLEYTIPIFFKHNGKKKTILHSGQYSTFNIHVLPFFNSALIHIEKKHETKKEGYGKPLPHFHQIGPFYIILYMTQYIAYASYTIYSYNRHWGRQHTSPSLLWSDSITQCNRVSHYWFIHHLFIQLCWSHWWLFK